MCAGPGALPKPNGRTTTFEINGRQRQRWRGAGPAERQPSGQSRTLQPGSLRGGGSVVGRCGSAHGMPVEVHAPSAKGGTQSRPEDSPLHVAGNLPDLYEQFKF